MVSTLMDKSSFTRLIGERSIYARSRAYHHPFSTRHYPLSISNTTLKWPCLHYPPLAFCSLPDRIPRSDVALSLI
jgi:hypothetical protein